MSSWVINEKIRKNSSLCKIFWEKNKVFFKRKFPEENRSCFLTLHLFNHYIHAFFCGNVIFHLIQSLLLLYSCHKPNIVVIWFAIIVNTIKTQQYRNVLIFLIEEFYHDVVILWSSLSKANSRKRVFFFTHIIIEKTTKI